MAACAKKCGLTKGCLAFEVYQLAPKACYIFVEQLKQPFTSSPACFACVRLSDGPPLLKLNDTDAAPIFGHHPVGG